MLLTSYDILSSLSYGSKKPIHLKCDYCFDKFTREYRRFIEIKENSGINKDACRKCIKLKNSEEFLTKINSIQINEILEYLKINNSISGIYSIRNKKNNKSYIGSSKNIIKRWKSHIIEINNKKHYCIDFNNVNIADLEFILIELMREPSLLVKREYDYIKLFRTNESNYGYNISNNFHSVKTNRKQSKVKLETKLKYSNFTIEDVKNIKISLVNGSKISVLAKKYNVKYNTIESIKLCRTWDDVLPELNDELRAIKYKDSYKGENNSCSKLTEIDVKEIKLLLDKSNVTMTEIAKKYNVSRTLIGYIKRGKLWSHVS